MKITAIDTFTLRIPTQKPIALDLPEHRLVVTRVRTDAGLEGLGYSLVFGGAGSEAIEAYARRLAVLLVGEDPTQVGRLWDKMYRADRGIRKVGAARYLMPDVCRANGFTETLRIGALAAAHQIALSPHVVHELSVHVAAALPNSFLVEFIDWTPGDLFAGLPTCEGGAFRVPDRPGHGIALGPDAEKKYRLG